jgi:HK97 family phage prohead protease
MMAPVLRTSPVTETDGISILKANNDLVIAGYASVEMVDKQGDLITRHALRDAFDSFMKADSYRNVQLAHSNIQVGKVIPEYTDTDGRVWKSTVDDAGMFVVIRLRGDIEKAREVASEIRKGNLKGFSIGGQAFKRINKHDSAHGDYTEISKLELHEVTICEKGINPEATFRILKEDKVNKMNEEDTDALGELSSVLDRLNKRLDDMEKGEFPFPPPKADDNGDDDDDSKDDEKDDDDDSKDDEKKAYGDEKMKAEPETITSEYLSWMEDTLKGQGVDTLSARSHFENVEKANLGSTPGEIDEAAISGQVKGRAQEGGNPSTGAVGKVNSGKVKKSDFLAPTNVSPAEIEQAYEVYKAAALEEQFKNSLSGVFSDRLGKELNADRAEADRQAFDARAPLSELQKAISHIGERIDNIGTTVESGSEIRKAGDVSIVEIPSTEDLANMGWEEVHRLAGSVWN